jgi:hypothetical protein
MAQKQRILMCSCAFLSKIKTHLEQVYSGGIKGKVRFSAAAGRLRGGLFEGGGAAGAAAIGRLAAEGTEDDGVYGLGYGR